MRHWIEFALFQLVKWLVLSLPLRTAQRLGARLGEASFHLLSGRKAVALDNLRHAFPERPDSELLRIAKGAFRNYGITMMELLWFPNLTDPILRKLVHVRNMEVMVKAHERGRGMVMLSGHFGNWELIALAVAYLSRLPLTIIVQTQSNARVDAVINKHRCVLGNRVVPMGISVREILRALQEGRVVAIAPDQSGPTEGVYVDFFGRRVASHQGPAVFALKTGAPLQIGFIIRQPDGSYEVELEEVPSGDLEGATDKSVVELTRRHTAMLERYIRLYPDHWLWMHRRWKHTEEAVSEENRSVRRALA